MIYIIREHSFLSTGLFYQYMYRNKNVFSREQEDVTISVSFGKIFWPYGSGCPVLESVLVLVGVCPLRKKLDIM